MTLQRRRFGAPVEVYGLVHVVNSRGQEKKDVDLTAPVITAKGWLLADADRYQDVDMKGDQEIVMFELGMADHPAFHDRRVASGSRVKWDGHWWDVVHPPVQRRGANRHVRHWRLSLRRRPIGDM